MIQIMLHIPKVSVYISLHIPCSFAYKVVCIDDKLSKPVVFYIGKMQLTHLLKKLLNSMIIVKT